MNESEFNTQSLRELLQYVPKVAGKVFLIDLPWSQYSGSLKSELMLDLITLQSYKSYIKQKAERLKPIYLSPNFNQKIMNCCKVRNYVCNYASQHSFYSVQML